MYTRVTKFIQSRIAITNSELKKALEYSEAKAYAKGDYLLRVGEYCRYVWFLNSGLVMSATVDSTGNEKASGFIYEGCFFTYTEGFFTNTISHKTLVALEGCETLILAKSSLAAIFKQSPKFESLLSQLLAEEVRNLLVHEEALKTFSLEEQYRDIENQFPGAFQRIPLKHLAGYLGIEAPSLSRLRRRLAGK